MYLFRFTQGRQVATNLENLFFFFPFHRLGTQVLLD
jgi:hypothetical protein